MEESIHAAELRMARIRALLASAAVLITLLVLAFPGATVPDVMRGWLDLLFGAQILLALAVIGFDLLRVSSFAAERRALRRNAADLLAAQEDRRRAIEDRDELTRTVAGLRALNEHLQEELKKRDEAVASAVHELRNPLTSVHGYAQLMSRNLQSVQRQVEQLERLISDLLAEPGTRVLIQEEVDLAREASGAIDRLRLLTDAEVNVRRQGDGPFMVRGDVGRLGQVLDNLLRNAAKFSPPGRPIEVELRRDGQEIQVTVTDKGSGIPAAELGLIFERYYRGAGQRRDVEGEGIGLAVSREIVQAHGGRIWATSPGAGKGSTFHIALPAAPIASLGIEDPAATPAVSQR